MAVSEEELLKIVGRYSKVFIVKDDMTYDLKNGSEIRSSSDLGVLGFALTNGKGIKWLRIGEKKYVEYQIDLSRSYIHPSLGRKGIRIEEVI
ncbi:MAG: hypothetical protein QXY40_05045 [Candidatus Methanomethylicia archaeon]